MHVISKKDLNSAELETVTSVEKSDDGEKTANGEGQDA